MLKIAITGGIASGKSTICNHLEELGYKVFYSDLEAKLIIENNEKLRSIIRESFGSFSFKPDGSYNSSYIANIIFNNKEALKLMNSFFKPYIIEAFERFCERNKEDSIIFYEGAIIFENNLSSIFDKIICCYCSKEEVYKRLRLRNGYSYKEIESRISSQLSTKYYLNNSDYKIRTSSETWKSYLESLLRFLESGKVS